MSGKKAIAMVREYPEIKEYMDAIHLFHDQLTEQIRFLERRAKKIQEDSDPERTALWAKLEAFCKLKGLFPPEYSPATHGISYDPDQGLLYIRPKDSPLDGEEMMRVLKTMAEKGFPGAEIEVQMVSGTVKEDDKKKDT